MGDSAAQAASTLREEVRAIERMPSVQADQALAALASLQTRAVAGSDDALWLLYQKGAFIAVSTSPEPARVDALEPDFKAWSAAAKPASKALGPLALELVRIQVLLNTARYREARAQLTLMSQAQIAALPAPWNFLKGMSQAGVLEEIGDLDEALPLRLEALSRAPDDAARSRALLTLSFTYYRLGQHERAKAAVTEALQLVQAAPTDESLMRVYGAQSVALGGAGDAEGARLAGEKALGIARRLGDRSSTVKLLGNLSDTALRLGQYQRALELAGEALPLAEALRDRGSISLALHNGGIAKIHLKRVDDGEADVRRGIARELEQGGNTYAASSWRELGTALESVGRLESAMQAFSAYRELAEQITRAGRRKAIGEAQARFDEVQRKRETKLLAQRTALKEEAIQSERLSFALAGLGLAVAAALAVLVFLLLRRLRRTNALLALANKELAAQSESDPLTGLGNRRRLAQLLGRQPPAQVALFMLDIDHFKLLNDQFGHAGGDTVLVAVANRLKGAVREPLGAIRWGGEEFLLVVQDIEVDTVAALAQRLLVEVGGQPVSLRDGRSAQVTASLGYLRLPLEGLDQDLSLEAAVDLVDALMYQAKSHGRNQAWGLAGANLLDAEAVRDALADLPQAELDGRLHLRRTAGPPRQVSA